MKRERLFSLVAGVVAMLSAVGCNSSTLGTAQEAAGGAPFELIAVVDKPQWESFLGDTLRSVFSAPVAYVNQYEPRMDLMRIMPTAFEGFLRVHRNVLYLSVGADKKLSIAAEKNKYADGQLLVLITAPDNQTMANYLHENREQLLTLYEEAERDRSIRLNRKHKEGLVVEKIDKMFDMHIDIPRGYTMRGTSGDSLLVTSFEYPTATQGVAIYSYPYTGKSDFEKENLIRQRNNYMKNIPGPSDGSYMKTVDAYLPEVTYKRIGGRFWAEMRGFWDLEGDFMGGPMVSWSTLDTRTNKVVTIDCYIFSPKYGQRDLLRGVEHLIYSVKFPENKEEQQ